MRVRADEDNFGLSEGEIDQDSDHDVSFRPSQDTQDSREESQVEEYPPNDGPESDDPEQEVPPPGKMSAAEKKDRIQQIDHEMKIKLQELQALMEQGGLCEAVAEVENMRATTGRPSNIDNLINRNDNATMNKGRISNNSQSEETIYESAVKKRGSSSSEDALINTSDEIEADSDNDHNDLVTTFLTGRVSTNNQGRTRERRSGSATHEPRPGTSQYYPENEPPYRNRESRSRLRS